MIDIRDQFEEWSTAWRPIITDTKILIRLEFRFTSYNSRSNCVWMKKNHKGENRLLVSLPTCTFFLNTLLQVQYSNVLKIYNSRWCANFISSLFHRSNMFHYVVHYHTAFRNHHGYCIHDYNSSISCSIISRKPF